MAVVTYGGDRPSPTPGTASTDPDIMAPTAAERPFRHDERGVMTIKKLTRLLLAGAVTLGALVPGLPAEAAWRGLTTTLTCDGASHTVSASVAGSPDFGANAQVTVSAVFRS